MPRNAKNPASNSIRRITAIAVVRSDPNQRLIKVNGRVVARLTATQVDRLGLRTGSTWSKSLEDAIAASMQELKARTAALSMLSRRAMTTFEVGNKLQLKGFPAELALRTVSQLASDRWIDDEQVATQEIESARRRGPMDRSALLDRLARRGIDGDMADRAIKQRLADRNQQDDAIAFVRRMASRSAKGGPRGVARRAAAALARRGFEPDSIEQTLREAGLLDAVD